MSDTEYFENFDLSLVDETDEYYQSRLDYSPEEIEALAKDIDKFGQRNPVGLVFNDQKYRIIYGFQRVKALKHLGRDTVKALVYSNLSEEEAHIHSISDNVRIGELTDLELALRCKYLKEKDFTIEKLCETFGVKKSVVYNYLKVADLDESTTDCLQMGLISLNHAVELARLDDSKRLENLRRTVSHRWSVRDLKTWIKEGRSPTFYAGLNGWIDICPYKLEMVDLETHTYPEGYKGIKAPQKHTCEECEYFNGRMEKGIICSFDTSKLPPGIKKLLKNKPLDLVKEVQTLAQSADKYAEFVIEEKLRTERHAGELTSRIEYLQSREVKLNEYGITVNEALGWTFLADIPENEFEAYLTSEKGRQYLQQVAEGSP